MSSSTDVVTGEIGEDASDPTFPAPMTTVAEYGFEGRFEDWADDARYFEYSKAANPIGSGHTSRGSHQVLRPGPVPRRSNHPAGSVHRTGHPRRSRDQSGVGGALRADPRG